jgi:uncharacterized protein YegJ (DUF2314 family)
MPKEKPSPGRVALLAGAVLVLTGGVILYRQGKDGGGLFGFGPVGAGAADAGVQPVRVTSSAAPSASAEAPAVAATAQPAQPELRQRRVRFELSVYYPHEPSRDPVEVLRAAHSRAHRKLNLVQRIDSFSASPALATGMIAPAEYAPPPPEVARPLARGVRDEELVRLAAGRALAVAAQADQADALSALEHVYRLVEAVARDTGGVICERETSECFSPDAFREVRVNHWTEGLPQVDRQIAIRSSAAGELMRAETRGMNKLGLPDLLIDGFPSYLLREVGLLLTLAAQTMLERGRLDAPGRLALDINTLRQPNLRKSMLEAAHGEPARRGELRLLESTLDSGAQPPERRLQIALPDAPRRAEALDELVSGLFGKADRAARVEHDAELLAASERARTRFAKLAEQGHRGALTGERILVKAPFLTANGRHEWMWVEILRWEGDRVHGVLMNAPFEVPGVKAGAEVEVPIASAFDYLRTFGDGGTEGNETGTILERREGRVTSDAGVK